MTDLHVAGKALELSGIVSRNPELAVPLLELLEATGGDLAKLQELTAPALPAAKGALPPVAEKLADLRATGVVIVGEKEAAAANVAVPEKFSVKALQAQDPYDASRTVAQTHGLGFDNYTKRWQLVRLEVIPNSLGLNRAERIALPQHEFVGLKTSIPASAEDAGGCYRVITEIVKGWRDPGTRPFTGTMAATDHEAYRRCRLMFGNSVAMGVSFDEFLDDHSGRTNVGALSFAT